MNHDPGWGPQQGPFGNQQHSLQDYAQHGYHHQQAYVAAPPARPLGLFDLVPCPWCGCSMIPSAQHAIFGRMALGFVGTLLVRAFTTEYHCLTHGQVPRAALPIAHQHALAKRKRVMLIAAAAIFLLAFGLIVVLPLLSGGRDPGEAVQRWMDGQ